ncbi:hypothetical protein [Bacteroides sp.]|uniref:hypothetical protein n=1 Tax=Bacteroides sp. TaxID=29523 RepID=UPI0025C3DD13|nr:hypothetical protein [Bacteroides sp.]
MDEFINQIENILTQLSEIEGKYDFSLADKYQGNIFPTQVELAVKMENLVHQITHEMGSTIAFLKDDIIELHRYIEFRKKYAILSDCELLFLIDNIGGELNIKKCINDKAISLSWLDLRQAILEDWKNDFGNMSFEKINSKLLRK